MAGDTHPTAILYTDLTGFPSGGSRGPGSGGPFHNDVRGILRANFQQYHGQEARTIGDAFLVEFESAVDAVRCAVEIQRTLHAATSASAGRRRFSLQIGIHVGTVLRSGWDVVGDAVDVAAWIQPLAEPGGICISGEVFERVRYLLDYPIARLDTQEFRNVRVPVEVYQVGRPWSRGAPRTDPSAAADRPRTPSSSSSPPAPEIATEELALLPGEAPALPAAVAGRPLEAQASTRPSRPSVDRGRVAHFASSYGTLTLATAVLVLPVAEFLHRTLSYGALLHVFRTIFPLVVVLGAAQVGLSLLLRS